MEAISLLQDDIAILRAVEAQLGAEVVVLKNKNQALEARLREAKEEIEGVEEALNGAADLFRAEPRDSPSTRLLLSADDIRGLVFMFQQFQGGHEVFPTSTTEDKAAFLKRMEDRRMLARSELKALREERDLFKALLEAERQKPQAPVAVTLVAEVDGKATLTAGSLEFVFAPGLTVLSMRSKS